LVYGLGLLLLLSGAIRIWLGAASWHRYGWIMVLSGLFGALAGLVILTGLATTSWGLALLLGIDLMAHGVAWLMLAWLPLPSVGARAGQC
jgi:uncharacterized membrane protein HdeD (DUF308 family)